MPGTILATVIILLLITALPAWSANHQRVPYPGGLLGLLLLILIAVGLLY